MPTILVVDGHRGANEAVACLLRLLGYEVFTANTFTSAKEILASDQTVDLVVTELDLPDGYGKAKLLEMKELNPTAKLVAISNDIEDHGLRVLERKGADFCFDKMDDPDLLIQAIRKLCPLP